jgi:hypothetical protein
MIIFTPRRGEERMGQRKLRIEVPQNLCSSPDIVIVIIKVGWNVWQVCEKILAKRINRRDHLGVKGMGRRITLK